MAEMPFRRRMRMRRPMLAPIVSEKRQKQVDVTYVGTNANFDVLLYRGVKEADTSNVFSVVNGEKVYSVDVSVNFIQESSSGNSVVNWSLVHLRAGQDIDSLFASTGAANWTTIGNSMGKNQVIKSFYTIIGSEDAGPRTWNLHIKLPKMWHRVRTGDELVIVFNASQTGQLSIGSRFKSYS